MIASLYDTTSLENYDIICLSNGLEAMGHDDDGTVSEELIECDGDRLF